MPKAATQARTTGSSAAAARRSPDRLASRPFSASREQMGEPRETASGGAQSFAKFPVFSFGKLLVQPKLTVGRTDDPLEHEADRVADQVMRMPDPALPIGPAPLRISRKCAACEKEDEDKEKLQMKPAAALQPQTGEVPGIVHNVLRSPGRPLDPASRAYFEPRFGHDLSGVRVHTDGRAAESAGSIGASAYTAGSNIAFAEGRYNPATSSGRRLLAHELTHVVQQRALSPSGAFSEAALIQRDVDSNDYKEGYEDGLKGDDPHAGPRDGDPLTDYNEGYAKGHYEFSQQSASASAPAPGVRETPPPAPAASQPSPDASQPVQQTVSQPAPADGGTAPAPAAPAQAQQGLDPNSIAYKQGYDDAKNGRPPQAPGDLSEGAVADYNAGYAQGGAPSPAATATPTPSEGGAGTERAAYLDQQFKGWFAEGNWPLAAEALNGFDHDDIQTRLAGLSQDPIANLHQGALDNPRVGPQSQVALLTAPGQRPAGEDRPVQVSSGVIIGVLIGAAIVGGIALILLSGGTAAPAVIVGLEAAGDVAAGTELAAGTTVVAEAAAGGEAVAATATATEATAATATATEAAATEGATTTATATAAAGGVGADIAGAADQALATAASATNNGAKFIQAATAISNMSNMAAAQKVQVVLEVIKRIGFGIAMSGVVDHGDYLEMASED
jgi:hypothetical protein